MTQKPARRYDTVGAFRPAVRPEPDPAPRGGLGGWLRGAVVDHIGLKVLALVLTLTVFLVVGSSDEEREITAHVGVDYVLPPGKVLISERVDEVRLTIKGPWRRIRRFDERELDRISLDLSKRQGGEVAITRSMIDLPAGLTITSITPPAVRVAFENQVEKDVEVAPILKGRPNHGYAVVQGGVHADPPKVTVRGPEGVVSAMSQVRTQDIAVDGHSSDFDSEATLLPPDGVELDYKGTVTVTVPIAGRWAGAVAVTPVGDGVDPARLVVDPPEVEVELTGTRAAIDRLVADGVRPTVRLPRAAAAAGGMTLTVAVDGVPSGVQVVVRPSEVRVAARTR